MATLTIWFSLNRLRVSLHLRPKRVARGLTCKRADEGTQAMIDRDIGRSGADIRYYGHFTAAQFSDCIDLLRNEKPVYFLLNDASNSAWLSTSNEPVGEETDAGF